VQAWLRPARTGRLLQPLGMLANARQLFWALVGSAITVAAGWYGFVRFYWETRRPEFPGGALLPATVIAGVLMTGALSAAFLSGLRPAPASDASRQQASLVAVLLVGLLAFLVALFTLMFALTWWPEWLLILFS
jgi:hypothetical protein